MTRPSNGHEPGRLRSAVVERAEWQPRQPQEVSADEAPPGVAQCLELDLTAHDDHERVPPVGLGVGPRATGRQGEHAQLEHRVDHARMTAPWAESHRRRKASIGRPRATASPGSPSSPWRETSIARIALLYTGARRGRRRSPAAAPPRRAGGTRSAAPRRPRAPRPNRPRSRCGTSRSARPTGGRPRIPPAPRPPRPPRPGSCRSSRCGARGARSRGWVRGKARSGARAHQLPPPGGARPDS
jgi:hypothetical protein